jgi:hypothetical protein
VTPPGQRNTGAGPLLGGGGTEAEGGRPGGSHPQPLGAGAVGVALTLERAGD